MSVAPVSADASGAALAAEAMIPPRFRGSTRESWRGAWPLDQAADEWPAEAGCDPWAIVLYGPPGLGKTHVATALWRDLLHRSPRPEPVWVTAEGAVDHARREVAAGGRAQVVPMLLRSDLLLLDDVGRDKPTAFSIDLVCRVLRHRHLYLLPTILTSNARQISDFDAFDPALTSRLRQGTLRYLFEGEDMREKLP